MMEQLSSGTFLGKNKINYHLSGIILSETVYHAAVSEDWHHHANPHCSLVLEGGNLEHRRFSQQEVLPGKLVRYAAGEEHRNLLTLHPSRNLNLEVEPAFWRAYGLPESSWDSLPEHALQLAILNLYKECTLLPGHDTLAHAILLQHWGAPVKAGKGTPAWVAQLQQLLHDRWDAPLSLHLLAEEIGIHPVTLSKYFPVYFHGTMAEYLRKIKVGKSLALVRDKKQSLTAIALQCGFFDQSHFIRNFKQYTGYLPGAFRKL
ncbi:helix-turn-helix transcriptional regulator [Chitinophaga sp. G-6-1-13]|uniref:Helix-turn-helix transcriptional regulator n=1 Tax=Chitinophaga fulva TaxID=2728842 RepID=A0A848GVR3_9BACT|nr:helix-turn-helix transcriptional regulator [Chitinophaga fulva]NML40770.1 helix-turn-helix transcriptional regulator [Chitinophaga fulva]